MESQYCPAFDRFFDETCDHAFAVAQTLTSDPTHAFQVARDAYLDLWRRRDHLPVTRDTLDMLLVRQAPDAEGGCGVSPTDADFKAVVLDLVAGARCHRRDVASVFGVDLEDVNEVLREALRTEALRDETAGDTAVRDRAEAR
jgi:hypothetical protein